jgi:hypothetical protein
MLLQIASQLTNKLRRRTSDPVALATASFLELLCRDIEAGKRKRACATCRKQYAKELAWTKDWWERTGEANKRKAKRLANSR